MTDISRCRRYLGLSTLAGLACALPLTATISYAASTPVASAAPLTSASTETQAAPAGSTGTEAVRVTEPKPEAPFAAPAPPATPTPKPAEAGEAVRPVLPSVVDRDSFDTFMADALKRIDRMRARMANADKNAAISHILQETMDGAPVRTIDCKAYRADAASGEAAFDPLAARICSDRPSFGSTGSLSMARSLIARNESISEARKSDLLANIDRAIAESGDAQR